MNHMLRLVLLTGCFLYAFSTFAQTGNQEDPVLFTVEGNPVHVSEFDYIYSKNTGKDTDYSEASLREYLDLYVKFKLKVQRAKELKMDTIPSLMKELDGYRKQLAKSYLTDKEVTNRLIDEVYERSKTDVKISHILFSLPGQATQDQIDKAYRKAAEVRQEIQGGLSFEKAVQMYSEDKLSKSKVGSLGFLTAMFPSGFYELENASYALDKGEVSDPVRTKLGIHLVRLDDVREARGEMEVAHILVRKKSQRRTTTDPKAKIDSLYQMLQSGTDFSELARTKSEDKASASNGGYIGYFGINRFEKAFEEASFGLMKDGDYSAPFQTSAGWHIVKRVSKKTPPSYEDAKKIMKAKVLKDPRYKKATLSMVDRIKDDAKFAENTKGLKEFTSNLDKSFFSYKWKGIDQKDETLFSFGDTKYSVSDFAEYAKSNTRSRLRMDELPIPDAVNKLYKEFVDESAIKFEEKQLEMKYPEFKSIMREYEEGILLFEVTKINVWDKASQDTVGLKAFYEANKSNYMWKERAKTKTYIVNSTDEKVIKKFARKAKKKSPEWLKEKFGDIFTYTQGVYERGSREVAGVKFAKKSISSPIEDTRKGITKLIKIDEIIPPALKTLVEARGYIEADYQDKLEKEWVSELRKKYKVVTNEEALKSLIK